MVYWIWFILGALALSFKNNKYITALVFAFIAILFCFNTANADLNNYVQQYKGIRIVANEPLFVLLSNIFFNAGASYELFRAFLSILSLSLITWTFYKLTPYPTLALFMYSIYPLTLDVTQIRFTLAYSIAFFGTYFLIKHQTTHKNSDVVLFIIFIILGTGFHYVTALYAILGLLIFDIRRHRFFYLIMLPLAVVVAVSLIDKFAPLVSSIIGMHKSDLWLATERNSSILRIVRILTSRALPMIFSLLMAIVTKNTMYKKIYGGATPSVGLIYTDAEDAYDSELDYHSFYSIKENRCLFICMFYIWVFSILEITVAGDYERLARLGLLLGSALITRQLFYVEKHNRIIMTILYLFMYILYFASVMFFMANKSGDIYIGYVFRQVMESNSLFGITYS